MASLASNHRNSSLPLLLHELCRSARLFRLTVKLRAFFLPTPSSFEPSLCNEQKSKKLRMTYAWSGRIDKALKIRIQDDIVASKD